MLELLALLGCVVSLVGAVYYLLAVAVAAVVLPFALIWFALRFVLALIFAPVLLVCGLLAPRNR